MKTLVIVDFQKDFANPSGSLYVNGAEQAEQAIIDYICKNHNDLKDVIFTVDWHSPKHCSFIVNGGTWPTHCVQYSEGAGISDNLIKACMDFDIPYTIFRKGEVDNSEEYGAFEKIGVWGYSNGELMPCTNNQKNNCTLIFETTNFVICGIAGDYCVKETMKNILNFNELPINIEVLRNGIASIDDGITIDNFIKENNLSVI